MASDTLDRPTGTDGAPKAAPAPAPAAGLRERKKLETRAALTDAALELFARRGFDETTVEDIADVVGVSPRTFHRYFARKEDVVFTDLEARLERFRAALDEGPDATVLQSVRRAATAVAAVDAPDRRRTRAHLIAHTPSLRAQNLGRYDEWARAITEFAAGAVGESPADRWPSTFGACVTAALSTASRRWVADGSLDLDDEYAAVLGLLEGLDRPRTNPPTAARSGGRGRRAAAGASAQASAGEGAR